MASPFVVDTSQATTNISNLLNQRINERLQKSALGGDNAAMVQLASRDPRSYGSVGSILGSQRQEAEAQQAQGDTFKRQVARAYSAAQTQEEKRQVLMSAHEALRGRQGSEAMAADLQDDIQRFESEFDSVNREYTGAGILFDTQEQLKARKSKEFANGAVINVLNDGSTQVVDENGVMHRQGDAGYGHAVKRAYDSEVALAGAKSLAVAEGKEGTEGAQIQISKAREELNQRLKQAAKTAVGQEFDADVALSNINQLLRNDSYKSIYGKGEKFWPEMLRGQDSVDALALRDQVVGLISLESREKLKGQGTITDNEAEELKRSATILANPSISDKLALREIKRVKAIFEKKKSTASATTEKEESAPQIKVRSIRFK